MANVAGEADLNEPMIKEFKKKFKIAGEVEEGCLFKYQKDIKPYVSSHHLTSARILYYEG